MKRIIKEIFDIKEEEYIIIKNDERDTEAKFKVVFSDKEIDRFTAICIEFKEKGKEDKSYIGTEVHKYNFDGLNSNITTDYISVVIDKNGKEIEIERTENKNIDLLQEMEDIKLMIELKDKPYDMELKEKIMKRAKQWTLELLKNDDLDLEEKKDIAETYEKLKELYAKMKNTDNEIEDLINKIEEE